MSHLIETVYNLLWGDLFTLPVGGGIGISLMAVLLLTAGVFFTLRTRLLPVRLFRDMIAAVCEKNQSRDSLSSFQTLIVSTATRVGMGNLVGVVAAVSAGGAGADAGGGTQGEGAGGGPCAAPRRRPRTGAGRSGGPCRRVRHRRGCGGHKKHRLSVEKVLCPVVT